MNNQWTKDQVLSHVGINSNELYNASVMLYGLCHAIFGEGPQGVGSQMSMAQGQCALHLSGQIKGLIDIKIRDNAEKDLNNGQY